MNIAQLRFYFLLVIFAWTVGCATTTNPLEGWTFREFDEFAAPGNQHHYQIDKTITDDDNNFITKKNLVTTIGGITGYYENGTGQRAVEFQGLDMRAMAFWQYVLIYGKENKRIKVVKYGYRKYQS
jgi:hypothetical protein